MAKDISQLPLVMEKLRRAIPVVATDAMQVAAKSIAKHVILETPVDTGVLRSNWIASRNLPFEGTIPAHNPLPKGTNPGKKVADGGNGATAIALANSVIGRLGRSSRLLWLTNNVNYIQELNATGGTQSIPGFVNFGFSLGVSSLKTFPFVRRLCRVIKFGR